MSYDSLLISTCDVMRNFPGAVNDYGHQADNWSVHLDNEACRLVSGRGREIQIGAEVVIADYILHIGTVDVTEQDRILLDGITYEILTVRNFQDGINSHHRECYLRTVR